MTGGALAARLVLAAVFAVAGVAKLADLSGSVAAMEGFGVPARLAPVAGRLLPVVEIGVAVALLVPASAWCGAVAAVGILGWFILGIATSMVRGRAPDCHCFGQLHSAPAGPWTLARNVGLSGLAVLVVARGVDASQLSPVGWVDRLSSPELVLVCVVAVLALVVAGQGWFLWELFRQNGRILGRLDGLSRGSGLGAFDARAGAANGNGHVPGLAVGAPAPSFELQSSRGKRASLRGLVGRGRPVLLVFTDPSCGPCKALMPSVARWQQQYAERLTVAVLSSGPVEAAARLAEADGIHDVLNDDDRRVAQLYEANGTPSAVLISAAGAIASPLAAGAHAIENLTMLTPSLDVMQVPRSGAQKSVTAAVPAGLAVGDEVPPLTWSDLDGRPVALADFQGRQTALVFWHPHCGFCKEMLPELRQLDIHAQDTHGLLVISGGEVGANRALGLSSPVVLEDGFQTGRVFGARGTPSAVLISSTGRVASPVAVGRAAILTLLGSGEQPGLDQPEAPLRQPL